jgi:hypothetical protein
VPIIIRDSAAVRAAQTTHKQLSMGYATELVFPTDGKHPDGTACDAYQTNLRINHIALCRAARGGPELRIVDERPNTTNEKEPRMAGTITVDGLPVSLADEAAVRAVLDKLTAKVNDAEQALADARAEASTANGKVAALEAQLADAKAELAPAKLDARVADRAALVTKAKAIKADIVTDGKADADIRKEVVTAKLGDAAATLDDAGIVGAFAALTADAKAQVVNIDPGKVANLSDAAASVNSIRLARYS